MILNWKACFMGQQARLQIIEREGMPTLPALRKSIRIVNLRLLERQLWVEAREEDGAPYDWHPGLEPPEQGFHHSALDKIRSTEAWLDRLASHYHVYEVQL